MVSAVQPRTGNGQPSPNIQKHNLNAGIQHIAIIVQDLAQLCAKICGRTRAVEYAATAVDVSETFNVLVNSWCRLRYEHHY